MFLFEQWRPVAQRLNGYGDRASELCAELIQWDEGVAKESFISRRSNRRSQRQPLERLHSSLAAACTAQHANGVPMEVR